VLQLVDVSTCDLLEDPACIFTEALQSLLYVPDLLALKVSLLHPTLYNHAHKRVQLRTFTLDIFRSNHLLIIRVKDQEISMFSYLKRAFNGVDPQDLRRPTAVSVHKVPHEGILTLLLSFLLKGKDLLFLLVHGPHRLKGVAHVGDTIQGLEEVALDV
jgi:hypothetical protein